MCTMKDEHKLTIDEKYEKIEFLINEAIKARSEDNLQAKYLAFVLFRWQLPMPLDNAPGDSKNLIALINKQLFTLPAWLKEEVAQVFEGFIKPEFCILEVNSSMRLAVHGLFRSETLDLAFIA